jgi:CxxC motif-containing protein (DUF1111 family)
MRGLASCGLVLLAGCVSEIELAPLEEGEWLAGGDTTNRVLLGIHAFSSPAANLERERRDRFFAGNTFFSQNWVTAPASAAARDGLGPTFHSASCAGCHMRDGRGRPTLESGETDASLLVRLSVEGAPHPSYGGQLAPRALRGVSVEGSVVIAYEEREGRYGDGERYSLREPRYAFVDLAFGPLDGALFSPRIAPAVFGAGLLELVPEESVLALADPDDLDGDGVSGRGHRVVDLSGGGDALGRFGWKAEQPSVRQQTAAALAGDIGITSPLFGEEDCPSVQVECAAAANGGTPEIEAELFEHLVFYGMTLAVPIRRGWDDPEVLRGKWLFSEARCDRCHVAVHVTGSSEAFPELSQQAIRPYTDLLLHDMGAELDDGRAVGDASGREWRTPPLWGIGLFHTVNGHTFLLHDGRARGVAEAILWHGGEAEAARAAFTAMSAADRAALVRFVESL